MAARGALLSTFLLCCASLPAAHAARVVLEPIAVTDQQVPGLAEGVTWQQAVSGAHLFKSTMSHEGAAAFALELAGPGVVAFQNDHGLFYRHPDGRIELVARRGDQAPGQPADSRWFSFLPGGIAADGTLFFQARLDWRDGQAAPTTKEEHCLVRWRPGQAPEIITREGGPAPGMPAAILTPLPEAQFSTALVPRVSRSGLLTFSFAVTQDGTSRYIVFGPDAAGAPGPRVAANQRVPGLLGGEVFGDIATPAILDDAGRLLMRTTLAASPGGTPVPANADTVVVGTDAAGVPVVLAREGDPVPGVAGAVFANFDATESTAIGAEGRRAFIAYFVLETRYQCGVFQTDAAGALELVAGGGPAPGFAQPEAYLRYCRSLASTADGRLAFEADVEVGDDTYETLYAQDEDGSLVVVARWGDPAPGTDGIWYDLYTSFHLNGRGQIAFVSTWWSLSENASVAALWLYTPGAGSQRLLQGGDRLSLGPGDERTLKYIRQPWVHPAASGEADGRLLGITNDGEVFVDLYFLEPSINPQQYSHIAVVRLWVEEGADLPPQAEADSWPAGQETLLAIVAPGVLGNDGDPAGAALQARLGEAPAHGALTLAADGGFEYLPDDGFAGLDSFTYEACDPGGNCSPAEVTLEVMPGDACTVFTCDGTNGCAAAARPCGDDDPCTVDSCDPATGCRNAPAPDCCRFDSDCVDEDR